MEYNGQDVKKINDLQMTPKIRQWRNQNSLFK